MAADSAAAPGPAPAQHPFQAEVSRLLQLMVHSVYTEKDIFLVTWRNLLDSEY